MKSFISLAVSAFLLFYFAACINAQQISLSISPPLLETVIKPGKSILIAYKINNLGDPTVLTTKVVSFEPKDETGNIRLKNELLGPVRFTLDNADIQLNKPFFLKSGNSQQILLHIRIPDGAPEGDYYYTLIAETEAPPTIEGLSSSRAKASIGTNILITVSQSGGSAIDARFSYFDVLAHYKFNIFGHQLNLFDSSDKIPLVAIVENKGRNFIKPQGEIYLRGNFGETAKYEVVSQNILSQSPRLLLADPTEKADCNSKNKYYCQRPISLLISGFFIGSYRLSTSVNFGDKSPQISASTAFFAFPIKITIAIFLLIIVAVFIIKRTRGEEL